MIKMILDLNKKLSILLVLTLILTMFSLPSFAQVYIPPIGIPTPEFGINETVESVYGSDAYFTHYVDNSRPNATDTNNPNGSPTTPRATIPTTLSAGSVVEVRGGPYEAAGGTGIRNFQLSGTVTQPIFIRGVSTGDRVQILGEIYNRARGRHIYFGQYFVVENFDFYKKVQISFDRSSSYGTLRNSEIHNPIGSWGASNPTVGATGTHTVIYNNEIHDNNRAPDKDVLGIQFNAAGSRIWMLNNTIYNNGGNGIGGCHRCNTSASPTPSFIYIGDNNIYNNKEVGVATKYGNDIVISSNEIWGHNLTDTTATVSGIIIGADGYGYRTWIINNKIHDNIRGIRIEEAVDLWALGNVIYDITQMAFNIEKTNPNTNIIANTVYDADVFINQNRWPVPVLTVHNNIVVNMVGANYNNHMNIEHSQVYSSATFSNNLFWQSGNDVVLKLGTTSNIAFSTTADFDLYGFGTNNIISDPLFVDPPNNFTLTANSDARDAGSPSDAYQIFYDLYGIDIQSDIDGTLRPQGLGWDIGAFEFINQSIIFKDGFE